MNARPERQPKRGSADHPWVIRIIVVVAMVVLVGGILWATLLGHLF